MPANTKAPSEYEQWLDDGYEGGHEVPVEESQRQPRETWRFYIQPDNESHFITFLDDTAQGMDFQVEVPTEGGAQVRKIHLMLPFIFHEHTLFCPATGAWSSEYAKGSQRANVTCLASPRMVQRARKNGLPIPRCPVCEQIGDHPAQVAVYTVTSHDERTDRKGKVHKDEKRLFAVKTSTSAYQFFRDFGKKLLEDREQIKKKIAEETSPKKRLQLETLLELAEESLDHFNKNGLRGFRFKVKRTGAKTPGVGDSFEIDSVEDISKWAVGDEKYAPVNYLESLRVAPKEEVCRRFNLEDDTRKKPAVSEPVEEKVADPEIPF